MTAQGHGHGDHAAYEAARKKSTYSLAAFIWIAVIIAAFIFYKKGAAHVAHAASGHPHAAATSPRHVPASVPRRVRHAVPRSAQVSPRGKVSPDVRRRLAEARTWQARMRKNGHSLRARVLGSHHDTFEIRFPAEPGSGKDRAAQTEEIAKLRKAPRFFSHLQSLGFKRLAIRIGRRMVFSRLL